MNVEKFVDYLLEEEIEKVTDSRFYFTDGGFLQKDPQKLKDYCIKNFKKPLQDTDNLFVLTSDDNDPKIIAFFKSCIKRIHQLTKKTDPMVDTVRKSFDKVKEGQIALDLNEFSPVVDLEAPRDQDRFKMVHTETLQYVPNIAYGSWKDIVGQEVVNALRRDMPFGVFRYNPREEGSHYTDIVTTIPFKDKTRVEGRVFNTYIRPQWRMSEIENPEQPEEMKLFFEHLFPDPNCRRYVYEKIYQILEGRLEVFLVMNGKTGVGKGLFTEKLMRYGVGDENFIIAPVSWDRSNFNAWLKNKQVVLLDETKVHVNDTAIGKENVNLLKRIINERQAIEEKGKDPTAAIQSYASFFITSNNGSKNFKMEMDNRRFSVLDITETKLKEAFDEDDQKRITQAMIEDDQKRAEFFWWIIKNFGRHQKYPSPFHLWKGPAYWKFKEESLSKWQRFIVELCVSGDAKVKYNLKSFPDMFEEYCEEKGYPVTRWTINTSTVSNFVGEYYHYDEYPIGTVKPEGRENYLVVNPTLVPKKNKIKEEERYVHINDL